MLGRRARHTSTNAAPNGTGARWNRPVERERSTSPLVAEPSEVAVPDPEPIAFVERLDRFSVGGKPVELPIAGVFEIRDGKIAAWRDYFDMATWTRLTG